MTWQLTRIGVWHMAEERSWPPVIFTTGGGFNTWLIDGSREAWEGVLVRAWPDVLKGMAEALEQWQAWTSAQKP